jgi:MSHA biogenesis protein MshP
MCPDARIISRRRQRGVSLVAAIVVMLVLAGIGAYTMRAASTQHAGAANDVLGIRAFQAARSGLEWAAYQVMQGDLSTGFCNGGATTETLGSLAGDLDGFSVAVNCARTDHSEAGTAVRMYAVTATACNRTVCPNASAEPNYVERQLTAVLSR